MQRPVSLVIALLALLSIPAAMLNAAGGEKPVERSYAVTPPAPRTQTAAMVSAK